MIKGGETRQADHRIDSQFIDRWSPRAMSGEEIALEELMSLFEAARWAPSSNNRQPWRMLFARRGSAEWPLFVSLMNEGNRLWARNAAALVVFVSKRINERTGEPTVTHSYDTGAAWGYFALQGYRKGYVVHGMQGFDYERARHELDIPEAYRVEAMAAVGISAANETLPPKLRERERPSERRALAQTVCEGRWRLAE